MPFLFLLVFIVVPLVEIALLIVVGQHIGLLATILIVIVTAILGTTLLRQQGFGVMARVSQSLAEGKMPVEQAIEGLCLLVAGAFLLTPGLLTDVTGFLLLVPVVRIHLARAILRGFLRSGNVHVFTQRSQHGQSGPTEEPFHPFEDRQNNGDQVIDGEYTHVDDQDEPRRTRQKK
ncbi:MAG: FxsA family protein [Filomicrobium sp.]